MSFNNLVVILLLFVFMLIFDYYYRPVSSDECARMSSRSVDFIYTEKNRCYIFNGDQWRAIE